MEELYPRLKSLTLLRVSTILVLTSMPKRPIVWRSPRSAGKTLFRTRTGRLERHRFVIQAYQKRCPLVIDYLIDSPPAAVAV